MKNKSKIVVLFIFVIMIILVSVPKHNYVRTIEKAVKNSRQILYTNKIGNKTVVFYEPINYPDSVNVALVKKNLFGYYWVFGTGTDSFDANIPMTYGYSNIGESSEEGSAKALPIVHGIITDDSIKTVKVRLRDGQTIEANIVKTNLGRVWYAFLNKQINYTPEIIGLGEGNGIVFTNK